MEIKQYQTTKYIMGNGALREVQRWKDKKIGLVVDENVLKALQLETMLFDEILKDCDYEVLCNMPQEPTTELLEPAIQKAQRFDPDVFVAIGGGSVIDSAKVLWLFTEFPDYTWEQAFVPYAVESFTKEKELIAIPTTSGTGSETTGCAVVKDTEKRKCMVLSNEIIPSTAILDYDLLISLPKQIIAFSGCDALAHALEAGISVLASDMVRMQSVQAAVQIIKQLEASCNGDLNARRDIHLSATIAGACINNSITGMAHGMDQAGGDFRKPHGLMTGLSLPYTMCHLLPQPLYEEVADQLGICGTSMEKQERLIARIWEMYRKIDMPVTLQAAGIERTAYMCKIDTYVKQAMQDANVQCAPKTFSAAELKAMYQELYDGKEWRTAYE